MSDCGTNQYIKWEFTGDEPSSRCITCPEIRLNEESLLGQSLSDARPQNEEELVEYFRRKSETDESYNDLLLNYRQCGNYGDILGENVAAIEKEYAIGSKGIINIGSWDILENITEEEYNKCSSSDEVFNLKQRRICEIINFYKQSDGYLEDERLNNEIKKTFGKRNQTTMSGQMSFTLPEGKTVREYREKIHDHCGKYVKGIWNFLIQDLDNSVFSDEPSPDKIIMEEIYDFWLYENQQNKKEKDSMDGMNFKTIFSGMSSSSEFETCMNTIFDSTLSKNSDYDNEIQIRIKNITKISDLTDIEINYIEDKLKIISTIDPEDAHECMNILNIGESICEKGISDKLLKMGFLVFHIMGMDNMDLDNINPNSVEYHNLTKVINRLTPYIRSATSKIIEISKYYEEKMCGRESTTTRILELIYVDIFEKSTEVSVNINSLDFLPTYLIKDTNLVEFIKILLLLIVGICGIYVLLMVLNRPVYQISSK